MGLGGGNGGGGSGGSRSIIRLNPAGFEFRDWTGFNYYLYIICEDEAVARQVQKLDMSSDQYEKHMNRVRGGNTGI